MAGPFTPGASIDTPPAGDVERQAVASLRGYAYQVAAAALAWLDVDDSGKVYLEVAEDYATVAQHSLDAVQVKDTVESGSVTLNTEAVREAINAFVTLAASNKDRYVQLRYFTTSRIGTEHKISDRPAGEAGLLYWRQAAAGADVGPLRTILTRDKFSADVHAFVKSRSDEALRRDLLHRIYWDCGKPDLAGITQEIEERLVVLGRERFNLPATEARQLTNVLLYHVLKKSVLKNAADRVLTRAELYSAIDAATQSSVSRQTVGSMLDIGSAIATALAGGQSLDATFSAVDTSWLNPSSDLATPRAIISRQALAAGIEQALVKYGRVILVGGSGLGKSLLARKAAGKRTVGFVTVDLREVDAGEAARRLGLTLGRMGTLNFDCLIFDDFNRIEDGQARTAFARCVQALHRRDRTAIVTAYRRPSQKALTELGLDAEAVIEIPYLTEEEAMEIVRAANGDSERWGRIAFAAGAQGHPQLVHAFVMGMAARGWPRSEVREIAIRGFSSDDTDAERDAARRSMVTALSEDARNLVYRLSLVIGRFNRALALKIAEVPLPIQRAGELLDSLIGPWIEVVGKDALRVSPLAANAGQGMLTGEAQQAIHAAIAIQMLAKRRIDATDASGILMHGLLGKETSSLFQLAYSVLTAGSKATELLREHFFMLPMLRMDQPIFATNRGVSVMLRLAQFNLLASNKDAKLTASCVEALFREISEEQHAQMRDMFESIALASIVNTIGIASWVPNWVDLLQRFMANVESSPVLQTFKEATENASKEVGVTFYGMVFSIGIGHLQSVKRLEEILTDLDRLSGPERSALLEGFESVSSDYSLLVNPPWTEEQRRNELNAADAAERYKRMALLAQTWRLRALAVQCYVARAVMFDEYMNDENGAQAALDEAVTALGEDVVISRARARIFWRHNKYHDAVKILRGIADVVGRDSPIDRAFAMREAAISAAKTDDWAQAVAWFGEAGKAAAASGTSDMQTMAVGLEADRAVALLESGNVEEALQTMASCLTRLSKINPDESLRAAYCHRVVRHTVLWLDSKIDQRETLIDGKPIVVLAGTCSNPEPPASITELPLGPLDLAWYMLAEAETSSGHAVGIVKSLRSQLKDGPILFMEITLRSRRITMDVLNSDTAGFSQHLLDYLAGMEYLRGQGQAARDTFSVLAPPRGEVPSLSDAELVNPVAEGLAIDALMAFGLASALRGTPDLVIELQKSLTDVFGENYPGKAIVDKWRGADDGPLTALDKVVGEAIAILHSDQYLAPRALWEVGLRFFEKVRQSNFRKLLAPLLESWLRKQWKRIITDESFQLSRPMQTVPAIEANLAENKRNEAFIASLLLATAEAVGSPLGAEYEESLKEVASGDR
jgi:hypothetical protein